MTLSTLAPQHEVTLCNKNPEVQAVIGTCLKVHIMFKWYITEKLSLKVLKIAALIYGFYCMHTIMVMDGESIPECFT